MNSIVRNSNPIKIFILGIISILGLAKIQAQIMDPYPPSPNPDRIVLSWSGDPTITQSVSWRTDVWVEYPVAEIAIAEDGPDFILNSIEFAATTTTIATNTNVAKYHTVTFTSLKPNTLYAYRVGSKNFFSEWFQFKTASVEPAPYAFAYFGDAQNEIKSLWSRCIRQAFITMPDVDFMIHAGDLVDRGNNDREWGEWFHAGGWLFGTKSNVAVPGNHEYFVDDNKYRLSDFWRPSFAFPENGPIGLEETVYYFDYQDTRFICLNTMAPYQDGENLLKQKEWLKTILKDNPKKWTIVTQHHPIFSTKLGRDNEEIREAFLPIFEKYNVDLVLQGHDHTYGRGHNLEFGKKEKHLGPVYVVSVAGPKMYDLGFDEWIERAAANTQLYQIIKVNGNSLEYNAYTTTGKLYDAFELQKQEDGTNIFKDNAPTEVEERINIPERVLERMSTEEINKFRTRLDAYKERKGQD